MRTVLSLVAAVLLGGCVAKPVAVGMPACCAGDQRTPINGSAR